ncbi:MAG: type II toxin-antitoxin system VapC family toxin [Planctomycetota bacterium]|jgi:predicted nucleic acid-binding protein
MERIFVDTSAWLSFANRNDADHPLVKRAFSGFSGRLVTSNFVFDETVTLARSRLGHAFALLVGDALQDADTVDLIRVSADDETRAWTLFAERGDKRYSFTDCTSFVLMRRLGIKQAASLDADFAREGFGVLPG